MCVAMLNVQAWVFLCNILSIFQINEAFLKSHFKKTSLVMLFSCQMELNISRSKTKILLKKLYCDLSDTIQKLCEKISFHKHFNFSNKPSQAYRPMFQFRASPAEHAAKKSATMMPRYSVKAVAVSGIIVFARG